MTVAAAVVAAVLGVGAGGAHAAPPSVADQEHRLADQIADGVHSRSAGPITESTVADPRSIAADTAGNGPAQNSWLTATAHGLVQPDVAPPGTNDWGCRPSRAHPEPIVLVHGTWVTAYETFAYLSGPLKDAGYCVFTFNYGRENVLDGGGLGTVLPGRSGVGDMTVSAQQVGAFVDRVLDATGARKVNIVAHSQGAPVSRWYLKFGGGADKVDHEITLAGTNHGTTLGGIAWLGRLVTNAGLDVLAPTGLLVGRSGVQQIVGSDFLNRLNADGDTVPGVDYTVIGTRYDEVATPYDLTFLRPGPGAQVRNITLQDGCELDMSDHLSILYSPRALSLVLNALDPGRTPQPRCGFNPWLIGGGGGI